MAVTARIAAEHESFNRIRQVVPIYPNLMRGLLGTRESSPNVISIGSAVFAGFTRVVTQRRTDQAMSSHA